MSDQLTVLSSVIPQLYYDGETNLVDILEEYYRWLDGEFIDPSKVRSADAEQVFVDRLLEEYAPGIEKTAETNQRLLIKYATEMFRAKGTPRAVELFFRLVYNVNADVSFPRDSLFATSDATFSKPKYVEITVSTHINKFFNQYVMTSSGGIMFVEGIHKVNNRTVLLVSNIVGSVGVGDAVFTTADTRQESSTIVGSLDAIDVATSFDGFQKGQTVEFTNQSGKKATGYVSKVDTLGTSAFFDLESQGVGITTHPEINVSQQTLQATDITTTGGELFADLATIEQDLYAGEFTELEGEFEAGDVIQLEQYTGETLVGSVDATVVAFEQTQDAGGRVIVQSSGPSANVLATTYIVNGSNYGNNAAVTDVSASAEIVSSAKDTTIVFTSNDRPIKIGEQVFQYDGGLTGEGKITFTPQANRATIRLASGQFVPGIEIRDSANNVLMTPTDIEQFVGINGITNKFYVGAETTTGNTTFTSSIVSEVTDSSVSIRKLNNVRPVIATDFADSSYLDVDDSNCFTADSGDLYGIPVGNVIELQTNFTSDNYDYAPIATVKQPAIGVTAYEITVDSAEDFTKNELVFQTGVVNNSFDVVVDDTSQFERGQLILRNTDPEGLGVVDYINPATNTIGIYAAVGTWSGSGSITLVQDGAASTVLATIVSATPSTIVTTGQGVVVDSTSTTVTIVSADTFISGGRLIGKQSGAERDITGVSDVSSEFNDLNHVQIKGRLRRNGGKIAGVEVVHSQPGFIDGERVNITIDGNLVGTGVTRLSAIGKVKPRFVDLGSRPSGGHALFDGRYYQHLSYEIKTPTDIDKYPNNKQFLQLAGMEMFIRNEITAGTTSKPQSITTEVEVVDV